MADKKTHDPQEPVAITLPWEDWQTIQQCMDHWRCYHDCKMREWLHSLNNKEIAGRMARQHELQAANAERLAKIIEAAMIPNPAQLY